MQNKSNSGSSQICISEFGGIDRGSPFCRKASAIEMENFRILSDGSLEKRDGYKFKMNIPGTPRCIWSGEYKGYIRTFAVIGSSVYEVEISNDSYYQIGTLTDSSGGITFLFYGDDLYVFDGTKLFVYDSIQSLSEVCGYAPLYGDYWDPVDMGSINESVNMLCQNVIIRYKIGSTPSIINFGLDATDIVKAYFDTGRVLTSDDIELSSDGTYANCYFTESDCNLIVCITRSKYESDYRKVCVTSKAIVSNDAEGSKIYTYGGDGNSLVCMSKPVSDSQLTFSQQSFASSNGIYFPEDRSFYISGGGVTLTAIVCIYNMLLMFTNESTFVKYLSDDDNSVTLINATEGCYSGNSIAVIGDEVYTVCKGGIYKWEISSATKAKVSASLISRPVVDIVNNDTKIYPYAQKQELWLTQEDNRVLVYNTERDAFYEFTDIDTETLFVYSDKLGLVTSEAITIFTGDMPFNQDEYYNKTAISAKYKSNYIDFSDMQVKKRTTKMALVCDAVGEDIGLDFCCDNGLSLSMCVSAESSDYPQSIKRRLPLGRFSLMNFCLCENMMESQRIYSLTLSADTEK